MCYETSLTKSAKQIEKRTGARFIDQVDYRPYYHASSFNFPSLYGITDNYKKAITTMEWGMIAPWGTNDIENYRKKKRTGTLKGKPCSTCLHFPRQRDPEDA